MWLTRLVPVRPVLRRASLHTPFLRTLSSSEGKSSNATSPTKANNKSPRANANADTTSDGSKEETQDTFSWKYHFKRFSPLIVLFLGGWVAINTLTDIDGPPLFRQNFDPNEGVVQMSEEQLKEHYKQVYHHNKWERRDPKQEDRMHNRDK
eukprot:gb/GECG01014931.1/.p1 GENE.gb/GECG01014931.1/~~gb/GECG01014931.1/.p1  ORF type:complete len:151 (+),score=15.42 gb/GECG01014931.1/:1-453(+)